MTSTNFSIGLGDSSKNSSRVLKPPGGGTSDIFGAPEPPAPNTPRRARSNLQSSVFGPPTNDGNPVTGEGYVHEEKPQSAANNVAAAAPAAPTTNGTSSHSAPAQRTRVPPGGFSSGLW